MEKFEQREITMMDSETEQSPEFAKHCRVCGDKAITYNFNALTCDSCKSFFRRTAPRENELKCFKNGNCDITIETRKDCVKCRYKKCLAIGMEKSFLFKRKQPAEVIKDEEGETSLIAKVLMNSLKMGLKPASSNMVNESPYPSLTIFEKKKILDIRGYYTGLKEENTLEIADPPDRKRCMELADTHAEMLIKRIKNITPFQKYSIETQMLLVRNFMFLFGEMRFLFNYDPETEVGIAQDIFNQDRAFRVSIHMFDDMIPEGYREKWKENAVKSKALMLNDPCIRDMIITLGLFRQHDQIVAEAEMLRHDYLEHMYILTRYVQNKLKRRDKVEKHMLAIHTHLSGLKCKEKDSQEVYKLLTSEYQMELVSEIFMY